MRHDTPIAVTAGEPAGIGPDLCVLAAQRRWPVPLVVIADPELLRDRAARLGLPLQIATLDTQAPGAPAAAGALYVSPVPLRAPSQCGRLDPANAAYVLQTLTRAVDGCLSGRYAAMVTAPVHKGVINDAGIPFTGHTEFIAARCGGHLGREEIEVIEPVLRRLRGAGLKLEGPLPADTLFTEHRLQHADAVLAMYHDQGLPVLKHKGFGRAVNITLGLPIVRTSVDHGTALELAGRGGADPGSLIAAVETAIEMAGSG